MSLKLTENPQGMELIAPENLIAMARKHKKVAVPAQQELCRLFSEGPDLDHALQLADQGKSDINRMIIFESLIKKVDVDNARRVAEGIEDMVEKAKAYLHMGHAFKNPGDLEFADRLAQIQSIPDRTRRKIAAVMASKEQADHQVAETIHDLERQLGQIPLIEFYAIQAGYTQKDNDFRRVLNMVERVADDSHFKDISRARIAKKFIKANRFQESERLIEKIKNPEMRLDAAMDLFEQRPDDYKLVAPAFLQYSGDRIPSFGQARYVMMTDRLLTLVLRQKHFDVAKKIDHIVMESGNHEAYQWQIEDRYDWPSQRLRQALLLEQFETGGLPALLAELEKKKQQTEDWAQLVDSELCAKLAAVIESAQGRAMAVSFMRKRALGWTEPVALAYLARITGEEKDFQHARQARKGGASAMVNFALATESSVDLDEACAALENDKTAMRGDQLRRKMIRLLIGQKNFEASSRLIDGLDPDDRFYYAAQLYAAKHGIKWCED